MSPRREPEFDDSPEARRRRWLIRCAGKEQFESWSIANNVARRRSKKGKKGSVYKCQSCGKFHIGSPEWAGKRKKFNGKITTE